MKKTAAQIMKETDSMLRTLKKASGWSDEYDQEPDGPVDPVDVATGELRPAVKAFEEALEGFHKMIGGGDLADYLAHMGGESELRAATKALQDLTRAIEHEKHAPARAPDPKEELPF